MAALDQNAAKAVLKTKYPKKKLNDLTFNKSPALGMLPKDTDFGGENKKIPLKYGNPGGRSHNFSKAQANRTASAYAAFFLTRTQDYATASVAGETLKATKGDANAFVSAITSETDGAIRSAGQSASISLFRNGSGVRAKIDGASNVATNTITLSNPADAANFEVNQTVAFSQNNDGTGVVRAGTAVITQILRATGSLVFGAALNTLVPAVVNTDYISIDGDYAGMISGFDAWLVGDSVSATQFFGVNRQLDTVRLGGIFFDGSGGNLEEVFIDAGAVVSAEGGSPDVVFMNPRDLSPYIKTLGSKRIDTDRKATNGTTGYKGISMMLETGAVEVYSDRSCPYGFAYMLQLDTWELCSLGDLPGFLDMDENQILREAGADAYEIRVGYYANLACYAPGWNCKVKLR